MCSRKKKKKTCLIKKKKNKNFLIETIVNEINTLLKQPVALIQYSHLWNKSQKRELGPVFIICKICPLIYLRTADLDTLYFGISR